MTPKIAILITTIEREPLLIETVLNVVRNLPYNAMVIIGDQSPKWSPKKVALYAELEAHGTGKLVVLPQKYDIGLSQARNELVDCASAMGAEYCLLSADSIRFTGKYDFSPHMSLFESDPAVGIIGFHLEDSNGDWFRDLELVPGKHFLLTKPIRELIDGRFQRVDIVKNFFLARTQCLLDNRWDAQLKLCLKGNTQLIIKTPYDQIKCVDIEDLFPESFKTTSNSTYYTKAKIWTKTGWDEIVRITRRKSNEAFVKLKTPKAFIECTENHRIMVDDKEILAKDFKVGDKLELLPYPELTNELSVDPEWAFMLGFFLAEGTCLSGSGKRKNLKRVEFANQDIDVLKRIEKTINKLGIETAWYSKASERKDKCTFLRIKSPGIIYSYFYEFYINGKKNIPYYVYKFDKSSRESFIKGFWEGDGTKAMVNPLILAQKNKTVVNGIIMLSQDLYKDYYIAQGNNSYGEWWRLNLKNSHTTMKSNEITTSDTYANTEKYVYDIETKTHTFAAGIGNINVHNCEHESYFFELKQLGKWKVYYDSKLSGKHLKDRTDPVYANLRARCYNQFKQVLQRKYNLTGWVVCSP